MNKTEKNIINELDVIGNDLNAGGERLHSLDTLRGIAAFVVLIGHLFLMVPEVDRLAMPLWLRLMPLRMVVNGHASVILFFVLSGYVLSLPFLRGNNVAYIPYVIRRVCRIYIPFFFAILLAVVLYTNSGSVPTLGSDWFRKEWGEDVVTPSLIFNHLQMTGQSGDMWLNGVMWSLVVELRISIIFPFLLVFCRNLRTFVVSGVSIYAVATAIIIFNGWSTIATSDYADTFIITSRYIPFFLIGIMLSKHDVEIRAWLARKSKASLFGLLLLGLSGFAVPTEIYNIQNLGALADWFSEKTIDGLFKFMGDLYVGVTSGVLVVLVKTYSGKVSLFRSSIMLWLGKASYSLYLIHMPIMFFLFRHFLGKFPFAVICLLTVMCAIAVTYIFHRFIERPSILIGKKFSGIFDKKHVEAPQS